MVAERTGGQAVLTHRSRYIDTLRAVAILRVYLLHTLWLSWLPAVFPSIWVMFALAGCLTAASLERRDAWRTVRSRVRRLLPPLWALAAVAVPLMLAHGWATDTGQPLHWLDLAWWVVPLANPPASEWGGPFSIALWYLRAYLWLVLVSPVLWWAFRRAPIATLLALPAIAVVLYSPLIDLPVNPIGDNIWSTAAYGTCWLLGYARHTRLLDRMSGWACAALAAGLAVAGMVWGATHAHPDPLADMLWGTGYVLALMRIRPDMGWLDRVRGLAGVVTAVNARAVTIYVWHVPVVFAAGGLLVWAGVGAGKLATLAAASVGLAAVVLAVGWVEDLAARRRPALIPPGKSRNGGISLRNGGPSRRPSGREAGGAPGQRLPGSSRAGAPGPCPPSARPGRAAPRPG